MNKTITTPYRAVLGLLGCFLGSLLLLEGTLALIKGHWRHEELFLMEEIIYKIPAFRIWEFAMGAVAGKVFLNFLPAIATKVWWRNAGLLLAGTMMTTITVASIYHLKATSYTCWFTLYMPPFTLIILCLAAGKNFLSPILGQPALVLLGEASYSFYLLHGLFLEGTTCLYPPVFGHEAHVPASIIGLAFVLCALTSIATLKLIELPARRWMRDVLHHIFHTKKPGPIVDMPRP